MLGLAEKHTTVREDWLDMRWLFVFESVAGMQLGLHHGEQRVAFLQCHSLGHIRDLQARLTQPDLTQPEPRTARGQAKNVDRHSLAAPPYCCLS